MRIDIVTLFPKICEGVFGESILKRAQEKGLVQLRAVQLRDYAEGKHKVTDEPPYGGGQGMVLKAGPIFACVEALKAEVGGAARVILMSPAGRRLDQRIARGFAEAGGHVIVLCGHYEGIDHRVVEHLVDEEISVGDYVLTNGAVAACVFVDAVVRLIPGVLGDAQSAADDSFASGLLEYPQYTRPVDFRGWKVPEILLSGHHGEIAKWRWQQAEERTRRLRPDLLAQGWGRCGRRGV